MIFEPGPHTEEFVLRCYVQRSFSLVYKEKWRSEKSAGFSKKEETGESGPSRDERKRKSKERKVNRRKRKKRGNEVKKENVEEVKDANGEDENLDQDEFVEPFYEVEPMEDYILREQRCSIKQQTFNDRRASVKTFLNELD